MTLSFLNKPLEQSVFNFNLFNGSWNGTALSTSLPRINHPLSTIWTYWLSYFTHCPVPCFACNSWWYACKTWESKGFTLSWDLLPGIDNKQTYDGNVQLCIISHIPDNFQGVAGMVLDRPPKASRVGPLCYRYVQRKLKWVLAAQTNWNIENTCDLRPDDLSTKGLERLHGNWWPENGTGNTSIPRCIHTTNLGFLPQII